MVTLVRGGREMGQRRSPQVDGGDYQDLSFQTQWWVRGLTALFWMKEWMIPHLNQWWVYHGQGPWSINSAQVRWKTKEETESHQGFLLNQKSNIQLSLSTASKTNSRPPQSPAWRLQTEGSWTTAGSGRFCLACTRMLTIILQYQERSCKNPKFCLLLRKS